LFLLQKKNENFWSGFLKQKSKALNKKYWGFEIRSKNWVESIQNCFPVKDDNDIFFEIPKNFFKIPSGQNSF
jgi:hypothetical protein